MPDLARSVPRRWPAHKIWLIGMTLLLVLFSLLAPFNHDEDQYYAASSAAFFGTLYRDFIYLQTPLNIWLGQAIIVLSPDNSLWMARIVTGLMGAATLWIIAGGNRRIYPATDEARAAALIGPLFVISCYSFLFAATVFRNDMLPCLLATGAIAILAIEATDGGKASASPGPGGETPVRMALSGLLLGLAASGKINYILLPAAPALWLMLRRDLSLTARLTGLVPLGAGVIAGALPIFIYLAQSPEFFWWQIVHFGAEAPLAWYTQVDETGRLTLFGRVSDILIILIQGPALIALALLCLSRYRALKSGATISRRDTLLDLFIVIAFIAAAIPVPSWRQYFVILLPPLAMRLPGLLRQLQPPSRRRMVAMLAVFSCIGIAAWLVPMAKTIWAPGNSILSRWEESRWIGRQLADAGIKGGVATLSPHLVIDSGAKLDRRFTSGVFVYRWDAPDEQEAIARLNGLTVTTAASGLPDAPPPAIITGYEDGENSFHVDLEKPLRTFAENHGYEIIDSPFGDAVLYIRTKKSN